MRNSRCMVWRINVKNAEKNILCNIISKAVIILFGAAILYLLLLSMFSTSYISSLPFGLNEFVYNMQDTPLKHLAFLAVLTAIAFGLICLNKWISKCYTSLERIVRYIPLLTLIVGGMWVVVAQLQPLGDQQYILENADVIKNGMGSYCGYADMHPNQWGIILIILALGNICGEYNYLFFQFLNVVGFMIAAWYIRKLTLIITENERISNLVYIEISLFMPLFMYVCFVYGTIWGLAVMTAGFCHVLSYTRTKKWYHLVFAALLLELAAIIKSNYLIGAISALLILLINAIKERRVRSIAAMAVVVIVIMAANKTEALLVKCVTGEEMDRGVNKLGYVMMGLQENNALAEGWYNGFVDTAYSEDDEEYARINDELKEMLVERLSYFAHNPNETVRFFGRKIASEWNNPSFQGFWIYDRNYHVAQDMIGNSVVLNNVLGLAGKIRISRFIICILNLLQTFTLFGALMFCVYSFRQSGDTNICCHLILPIFFIGGFLFHLFWEAKAQYTLPYFVFLFPLALKGFVSFVKDIYDNNIKKRAVFSKATVVMLILIVMCFLIAFLPLEFNDRLFKIHDYEFLYDNVDMWN